VAHLPVIVGRLRKLEVAALIDAVLPPPLRMCCHVAEGSKPLSGRFWPVIRRGTRSAHGWQSAEWGPYCRQAERGNRSTIIGEGKCSMCCLQRT
jgi:hypothetical protein